MTTVAIIIVVVSEASRTLQMECRFMSGLKILTIVTTRSIGGPSNLGVYTQIATFSDQKSRFITFLRLVGKDVESVHTTLLAAFENTKARP